MTHNEIILTASDKKRIEEELHELRTVKRSEVTEAMRHPRDNGDPLDNGEYQSLCLAHAILNGRIVEMETLLEKAKVIDDSRSCGNVVGVGSTVTLKDLETGDELEYTILNSAFASLLEDGISDDSPVGQALLRKTVGEVVEIGIPAGFVHYKIVDLHY